MPYNYQLPVIVFLMDTPGVNKISHRGVLNLVGAPFKKSRSFSNSYKLGGLNTVLHCSYSTTSLYFDVRIEWTK